MTLGVREIYCCGCSGKVLANLVNGSHVYPYRKDLNLLSFWQCPHCKNFVGCHNKTSNPTEPLGVIPTLEIKKARQEIHKILDPIWQTKRMKRREIYKYISNEIGFNYHTSHLRSMDDCRRVYRIIKNKLNKL